MPNSDTIKGFNVHGKVVQYDYEALANRPDLNEQITVDDVLSDSSKNPVENKVVKYALDQKANKNEVEQKADKSDLEQKADKSDLEQKADKSDLEQKADKSELPEEAWKISIENKTTLCLSKLK